MATKAHGFEELSAAGVCSAATLGYVDPQERLGLEAWYVYMGLREVGAGTGGMHQSTCVGDPFAEARATFWEQVVPGLPRTVPRKIHADLYQCGLGGLSCPIWTMLTWWLQNPGRSEMSGS